MKNWTNTIIIVLCLAAAYLFFYLVLGNAGNFTDPKTGAVDMHNPQNALGMIYTGGPLVGLLIGCVLMALTYTVERFLSIRKAEGTSDMHELGKHVIEKVESGDFNGALSKCDEHKGSLANVLRNAIERFQVVQRDSALNQDQKLSDIQRSIDESMNLETPLLERNMVILSTVASISTMIGLLGTTIGMIRAFGALGAGGTVSAQSLSIGISEALYNTAGGLAAAIISIVAYNFFTTKVDTFVYVMDETILDLMETFKIKVAAKS
jgi:biopolymer transport protein ExbB